MTSVYGEVGTFQKLLCISPWNFQHLLDNFSEWAHSQLQRRLFLAVCSSTMTKHTFSGGQKINHVSWFVLKSEGEMLQKISILSALLCHWKIVVIGCDAFDVSIGYRHQIKTNILQKVKQNWLLSLNFIADPQKIKRGEIDLSNIYKKRIMITFHHIQYDKIRWI